VASVLEAAAAAAATAVVVVGADAVVEGTVNLRE
jgi:hypothetical protein